MERNTPVLAETAPVNNSRLGIGLAYPRPQSAFSRNLNLSIPRKKTGVIDDLRSGWLDAMKSSSPPAKKISHGANSPSGSSDPDVAYSTWMLKYPSALKSFEQITHFAKGKQLVLFLDYDGTLSPIVDNPDRAFMTDDMRDAVRDVASCFPTAIISGRSRDKVFEFVGLTELYYAGSHGMDIMSPARDSVANGGISSAESANKQKDDAVFQPASEFFPMIEQVYESLVDCTKEIEGANVENNKFCISVHYRNVDEKDWAIIAQRVFDILKDYPRLRLTHGRKVLEVRPLIDWNKGKAVEFLLESLGLNNREDVLPIYIGDDRTDEDAFKVLRDGKIGHGILVSSAPKESQAYYSLKDPSEVMEYLKALAAYGKQL
ncbi:hypothetical protein Droror1_Dr00002601 [Drosera rotundifolia]